MLSNKERAKLEEERRYLNNLLKNPDGSLEDIENSLNKRRKNIIIFCTVACIITGIIYAITGSQIGFFKNTGAIGTISLMAFFAFFLFMGRLSAAISCNVKREAKGSLDSIVSQHVQQRLEEIEEKLNSSEK